VAERVTEVDEMEGDAAAGCGGYEARKHDSAEQGMLLVAFEW
jgi:hypothetical protein